MPRVSREQTAANRQAIEEVSARLFREQGIDGVSVADLMAAAGLTHGGFYGHFESKDALAAVACSHAFAESRQRRERWASQAPDGAAALQEFTDRYLSNRHRDGAGQGCPAVALAADVGRQAVTAPVREAYVAGVKSMAGNVARLIAKAQGASDDMATVPATGEATPIDSALQDAALVRMSTMVGAVLLARATKGDPLSAQILDATRAALAVAPADVSAAVAPAGAAEADTTTPIPPTKSARTTPTGRRPTRTRRTT